MFDGHLTEFAGRPVVEFDPAMEDLPGPADVAWRIAAWEDDENWNDQVSPAFRERFEAFCDRVDVSRVEAIVVGTWGYAAFNPVPAALLIEAAPRLPRLRALFLGDILSEECELSWIKQGDLTELLLAYPRLEVFRSRGGEDIALRPLRHDTLREIAFESGGLPGELIRGVAACDLPALRHLELWFGSDWYGGDGVVDDVAPILAGDRLPHLTYLGLRDAEFSDELAAAVAGAPVVARLRELDLSLGTLSDQGAAALLAGQPLTHLRRLDLHHHYLSPAMMDRLADEIGAAGVAVDLSEREIPDEDDGQRYVAAAE